MKTVVIYYSRKGSNNYLARKIADSIKCDIEEIRPRVNSFFLFLMNIHLGIKPVKSNIASYDKIILCGPIWVGRFVPPLRSFVKRYKSKIEKLIFVTCCGSAFDKKDEKFGHETVFNKVKNLMNGKCVHCEAFPIDLVLPEDLKNDDEAFMNTHLNDDNFKGEIQKRFDVFINTVNEIK